MSQYGATIPRRGRELLARIGAGKLASNISRVMVGKGLCPADVFVGELEDLVEPVAAGTSTNPIPDGDRVRLTVEYRSDLNNGLERGFWIREFGVFARDTDGSEVLVIYGTLGDYPQWVSAFSANGGLDVRRYPVEILIGEEAEVHLEYRPEAFMTAEDVAEYCRAIMLPEFLADAGKLIGEHDAQEAAHPALRGLSAALDARLSLLELMYKTDVAGNPFTVTFESLDGLEVAGVWNKPQKRIEF